MCDSAPDISVVMSVYNGAETLCETIESILSQEGVSLEFIIVNDGSTDGTAEILDACAERDSRVRCIHQQNAGLTRALIRGCDAAAGPFIARQDNGDISLPGRLKTELDLIRNKTAPVMVCCGTRFILGTGETLYEVALTSEKVTRGLRSNTASGLRGPSHHGAVMFRTDAYRQVGGYRTEFVIAQDLDLWVRLAEIGDLLATREVLYQAEYAIDGISPGKLSWQQRAGELILTSAERRRAKRSDADVLRQAEILTLRAREAEPKRSEALYFVGAMLLKRSPEKARHYFRRALQENPGHLKAWIRFVSSYLPRPI